VEKIVALNSGGFDSVVMLHHIKELYPYIPTTTLFFNYGQKNLKQEYESAKRASDKLKFDFKSIDLPKFSWTSGDFYTYKYSGDKEYLEMRNLIFLSYGLSLCESIGADALFLATLVHLGYYDTSPLFFEGIRMIAEGKDISIEAPFSEVEKVDLIDLVHRYRIKEGDFFTCDNPVNDLPCGECPDCLVVKDIFSSLISFE